VTARQVWLDGAPFDPAAAEIASWQHDADVESTMDVAHHRAAAGAPSGTLVLADVQRAGRGRAGKSWVSRTGEGVWFTLVERDVSSDALQVLSLRIGLALVRGLAPLAAAPLWLKWPNDVLQSPAGTHDVSPTRLGKLAGVLVEARWRESHVEWVAIGVGINVRAPQLEGSLLGPATALRDGVTRADVLMAVVPPLRAATRYDGPLSPAELAAWQQRDAMIGQACVAPGLGVVQGIDATGALLVSNDGAMHAHRSGSLQLAASS